MGEPQNSEHTLYGAHYTVGRAVQHSGHQPHVATEHLRHGQPTKRRCECKAHTGFQRLSKNKRETEYKISHLSILIDQNCHAGHGAWLADSSAREQRAECWQMLDEQLSGDRGEVPTRAVSVVQLLPPWPTSRPTATSLHPEPESAAECRSSPAGSGRHCTSPACVPVRSVPFQPHFTDRDGEDQRHTPSCPRSSSDRSSGSSTGFASRPACISQLALSTVGPTPRVGTVTLSQ